MCWTDTTLPENSGLDLQQLGAISVLSLCWPALDPVRLLTIEYQRVCLAIKAGSGVKLSVTASTGLFTGSFADGAKRYTFKGVLIPESTYGAGYWLWPLSTNNYRLNISQPVEIKINESP